MLGNAIQAATAAQKLKEKLDAEKRQKKINGLKKPRKQGWFKPGAEQQQQPPKHPTKQRKDSKQRRSKDDTASLSTRSDSRSGIFSTAKAPAVLSRGVCVPSPGSSMRSSSSSSNFGDSSSRRGDASRRGLACAHDDTASVVSNSTGRSEGTRRAASVISSSSSGKGGAHLVDALMDALDNDRMADVTLTGRDGAKVRATKYVLACQSKALQEKLYKDPTALEVHLGNYGEEAIRAMKEFCQTGKVTQSPLVNHKTAEVARGLTELAGLSRVYGFEVLYREADAALHRLLVSAPWFTTASFDATGSPETKVIHNHLVLFLEERCPDLLLETSALKHLRAERFDNLLMCLRHNDQSNFLYLKKWIDLKGATAGNTKFAQLMAKTKISLTNLLVGDPSWIATVRNSGFWSYNEIDRALQGEPSKLQRSSTRRSSTSSSSKQRRAQEKAFAMHVPPATPSSPSSSSAGSSSSSSSSSSSASSGSSSSSSSSSAPSSPESDKRQSLHKTVSHRLLSKEGHARGPMASPVGRGGYLDEQPVMDTPPITPQTIEDAEGVCLQLTPEGGVVVCSSEDVF